PVRSMSLERETGPYVLIEVVEFDYAEFSPITLLGTENPDLTFLAKDSPKIVNSRPGDQDFEADFEKCCRLSSGWRGARMAFAGSSRLWFNRRLLSETAPHRQREQAEPDNHQLNPNEQHERSEEH